MSIFKIINNNSEITLNNKWIPSTKFKSKNRIVDGEGNKVSSDYQGRQYRIVEKRERSFSAHERIGRGFLGTLAVVCTLCLALFSKSIRNLITKSKENIRFAVLEEQTKFKIEDGKVVYLEPELLFKGVEISDDQELNFAVVKMDGKQELVPVTRLLYDRTYENSLDELFFKLQDKDPTKSQYESEYRTYEGSAIEALLKLAQDEDCFKSPIGHFLKHPNNSIITEEEFFKFILEKHEDETPRIFTLNSASTLEVLNVIKEKNIPINLYDKTPQGETLFTLWVGKGEDDIIKLILDLDPSVIEQTQQQTKSAFVKAVLIGYKTEADLLIDAMGKKGIDLSQEELWILRAFRNDCVFAEEEFTHLDQELKLKIFFTANAYGNEDIVKKLQPLGMDTVPLFLPGPSILAHNMDIITVRNVMEGFLKSLRKDHLLLTTEEFNKLDKSKYISKANQIGRIQGKNFIEKLVKENGLKHIKVPKKIAVINTDLESVSFHVSFRLLELIPKEDQLTIYAERIEPVDRQLSLEEAIEFMIILEKTGYSDFCRQNFLFAEDGIYFIDTEQKDFSPMKPKFDSIKNIKDLLDPKDSEKFLAEYEKRKEAYDKEEELHEAEQKEYRTALKNPYTKLSRGYCLKHHEFAFRLDSLFNASFG